VLNVRANKVKRAEGRRKQAAGIYAEKLEVFKTRVWPELEPGFQRGYEKLALDLCAKHGIKCSESTLDRFISDSRKQGVPIPTLRRKRRT